MQPFLSGPALTEALSRSSNSFATAITWLSSILWLGILVSLVVRLPVTLAVARIGVAGTVPVAAWAAIEAQQASTAVLAVTGSIAATAAVLAPGVADSFIDGAGYGDERRFALRTPGPVLITLVAPAWAVVVVGSAAGPILLADQRWLPGISAVLVGGPPAALAFNSLYRLTSRFIVFVPNGLVLHDQTVLREPVLFTQNEIVGLGPARADTSAVDLTNSALGLALELKLGSPATLQLVSGRKDTREHKARSLLIAPTRPADVMRTAARRGVGIA